jgi:ABC-type polysaccharide/polyol phosphate export permease
MQALRAYQEDFYFWVRQQMVQTFLRLKLRTRGSVLGAVWVVSHPYHLILLNFWVFGSLTGQKNQDFLVYLAAGYLPWFYFSQSIVMTLGHFLRFRGVVQSNPEDGLLLLLSESLANFLIFLLCLVPLLFFFPVRGFLFLPLALFNLLALTLAASSVAAVVQVFLRDSLYIVPLGLHIMLLLSPIMYPAGAAPLAEWQFKLINPVFPAIELFQRLATEQVITSSLIGQCAGVSVIALVLAFGILKSLRNSLVLNV